MVFLDLTNAFGCITHQLLWKGFDLQSSGHSVFSRYDDSQKKSLPDHRTTILPRPFIMALEIVQTSK